jgi:hypothetical protein
LSELPPVTPDLTRFVAIRLAGTDVKKWKQMDKGARDEHLAKARRLLKAERRFFERGQAKEEVVN